MAETYDSDSDYSTNYATSESEDDEIQALPDQFEPVMRLGEDISSVQAGGTENEEDQHKLELNLKLKSTVLSCFICLFV